MLRSAVMLILLAAVASPAAAQSNAERMANDRYTRSHDYDLIHQSITLSRFDWDSTAFDGQVVTTLAALRPGLDSVVLDAGHLLGVRSVTGAGGRLRHARHGDTLVVRLARPAAFRDTVRFTIDYRGKVENGRGTHVHRRRSGRRTRRGRSGARARTTTTTTGSRHTTFPNDKMTWEVDGHGARRVHRGVQRRAGERHEATRTAARTMQWRRTAPSATYLVSLVVAPLAKMHDTWRRMPVDYYVYHEDSALARPLFHVTPDMIDVYSRLTGVRLSVGQVRADHRRRFLRRHGERERDDARRLAARCARLPGPPVVPVHPDSARAGAPVVRRLRHDRELGEHVAERRLRRVHAGPVLGREARRATPKRLLRRRVPPVHEHRRAPADAGRLARLEQHLSARRARSGDAEGATWARSASGPASTAISTDHAFGNATTDDLRQAMLDATGENLDWFWDRVGVPGRLSRVHGDPGVRRGSAPADAHRPADAARHAEGRQHRPALHHAGGVPHAGDDSRGNAAPAMCGARGAQPAGADDGGRRRHGATDAWWCSTTATRILKKLTFDQPTAQLATQLAPRSGSLEPHLGHPAARHAHHRLGGA